MNPEAIGDMFRRLAAQNPHPQTELVYTNTYTLLIAVILSAQATDTSVNRATKALFTVADTPQKMIDLGLEGLLPYIKTIGLHQAKAKNIIRTSQMLADQFHGKVPGRREDLESLPGVGRKTASVVLNVAFQEDVMPVDTHIFRVANRLQLALGKNPREVEKGLEKVVPPEFRLYAHHWLLLHGRYTCKARAPLCYQCILRDLCPFENKNDSLRLKK